MPSDAGKLTPSELRQLKALIRAQAAIRDQLSETAAEAVARAFAAIDNYWDTDQTRRAVEESVKIVQAQQRRMAQVTDGYMAQSTSIITGRRYRPIGAVDVRKLRRQLPQSIVDNLAHAETSPEGVGPALTEREMANIERAKRAITNVEPGQVYGRIADAYRYRVATGLMDEETAARYVEHRARGVADTDIMLADRAQSQRFMSERKPNGVRGYRRVLHPELEGGGPPCGLCVVAADRVYRFEDLMPIHSRCVPAGTRVAAKGVSAISRREYSGSLVVLLTASGQEMTITANHPVLTDRGWIPAHLVNEGDQVVRHLAGEGVVGRGPAEGDGPPLIEEVWRSASMQGALHRTAMPLAAEDFHGDWSHGEVEVVTTNGHFASVGDVSFIEPPCERGFVTRHGGRVALPSESELAALGLGSGSPSASGIGGLSDLGAIFPSGSRKALVAALGAPSDMDPRLFETATQQRTAQAVLLREGQLASPSGVLLDDPVYQVLRESSSLATRFDPAFAEYSEDGRITYAQLGGDLLRRLAGHVELDRVVQQRRIEGTYHVYNLHTDEGWYSANNLIVSNCRCTVAAVGSKDDPGFSLNEQDLRRVYEQAGQIANPDGTPRSDTSRKRLKQIRVDVEVVEHGELGPWLVNPKQRFRGPREVAKTQTTDPFEREIAQIEAINDELESLYGQRASGMDVEEAIRWRRSKLRQLNARIPAA